MRIVGNSKSSKLMTESQQQGAPTLNFNKAFANINSAIDNYIQYLSKKSKFSVESFPKWKEKFLNKVKMKIKQLKSIMKQHQIKTVLPDDEVLTHKVCYCYN